MTKAKVPTNAVPGQAGLETDPPVELQDKGLGGGEGTPPSPTGDERAGPSPLQSDAESSTAEPAASPIAVSDTPAVEALVDPAVSRAKFERELVEYHRLDVEYLRRGWFLVQAEFPEIMVVFTAPQLQPRAVLFAVILDFSNYDLWPPSVRFVDPFTRQPFRADNMPVQMLQRRRLQPQVLAAGQAQSPVGMPGEGPAAVEGAVNFEMEHLIQAMADGRPFLCVAGVREYHQHPFHSNDPWLSHRSTGSGRLYHILNLIYRHGVAPLREIRYRVQVQPVGFGGSLEEIPERTP